MFRKLLKDGTIFPPSKRDRTNFPPFQKGRDILETEKWDEKKVLGEKGRFVPSFFAGRGTRYLGRDGNRDGNDQIGHFEKKKGRF